MIRLWQHVLGVIHAKPNKRTYRALQVGKENAEHHRYEEERHDVIAVLIEIYAAGTSVHHFRCRICVGPIQPQRLLEKNGAFFKGCLMTPRDWVV